MITARHACRPRGKRAIFTSMFVAVMRTQFED